MGEADVPGGETTVGTSIGRRLQAIHDGTITTPLPEWLEGAACGPAAKHLAHLALHTAEAGGTEDDWRAWVHKHVPEVSEPLLDEAADCMRTAGLWPWRK
jgi:hypothetical protein